MTELLIALAPLVAAVASLLLGWYPGEELLLKLAGAGTPPSRRRPRSSRAPFRGDRVRIPRGAELIPAGLAGRAPPLRFLVTS